MAISLMAAANSAAQFLGVLDSGESLSAQQLTDALGVANRLLTTYYWEQNLSMQQLVQEHRNTLQSLADQMAALGQSLQVAYTVANGSYVPVTVSGPSWVPSPNPPNFPDTTTATVFPQGYERVITLALAIELAPQYGVTPSDDLLRIYSEARAAVNPMPMKRPIPGQSPQSQAAPKGTTE